MYTTARACTQTDTLEPGVCRQHHVDALWGTLAPITLLLHHSLPVLLLAGPFPSDTFTFSAHSISWKSLDFLPSHSWTSEFPDSPSFLSYETNLAPPSLSPKPGPSLSSPCLVTPLCPAPVIQPPLSLGGTVSTPSRSPCFHTSYRWQGVRGDQKLFCSWGTCDWFQRKNSPGAK